MFMDQFTFEELSEAITTFSPVQVEFFIENCIVLLEKSNHKPGCSLEVVGETKAQISLQWSKGVVTTGYKEPKKIIEHAAEALSFMLARRFTEFMVVEEAPIGTGFDYWLGYDEAHSDYDPANFMQARLEVSGIASESRSNTLRSRLPIKKRQTDRSDGLNLPAYISVVEFSTPKAYFGQK